MRGLRFSRRWRFKSCYSGLWCHVPSFSEDHATLIFILLCTCRQHCPPSRWRHPTTSPHGNLTQKTENCIVFVSRRVYPKFFGLAAWSENCKWHSSLPRGAVVSLFWVSLVSFAAINLCVISQRAFVVVVYVVIDSVRKLLDTPSCEKVNK
jgi:hypothetical protein